MIARKTIRQVFEEYTLSTDFLPAIYTEVFALVATVFSQPNRVAIPGISAGDLPYSLPHFRIFARGI